MQIEAPGRVEAIEAAIADWVERAVPDEAAEWYRTARERIRASGDELTLVKATGLVPRKLGKSDRPMDTEERRRVEHLRPGFDATELSLDQAARIGLLLAAWRGSDTEFARLFDDLCRTAEINELIAYLKGLPLYPAPDLMLGRAREGLRSGMRPVFEAVAHRSPYPREMLDQHSWNQMVLKALFIDSTLAPIQGLDERADLALAETLVDYAHERWAAKRSINPELWRCVLPFVDDRALETLRRQAIDVEDHQSVEVMDAWPRR